MLRLSHHTRNQRRAGVCFCFYPLGIEDTTMMSRPPAQVTAAGVPQICNPGQHAIFVEHWPWPGTALHYRLHNSAGRCSTLRLCSGASRSTRVSTLHSLRHVFHVCFPHSCL